MYKVFLILGLLLPVLILQSCNDSSTSPNPPQFRELTANEKNIVQSDNVFSHKIFKQVAKSETGQNIFISPLSISMALGMTLNGANGTTYEAIKNTLEFQDLSLEEINQSYQSLIQLLSGADPKVIFQIANSVWYRQIFTFEQDFIERVQTYFNALVQGLDFNDPDAKNIINQWVNQKTNGRIKAIVDFIDPNDVMFLINAIYFKGIWTYQFNKNLTKDDFFTLPNGTQKPCKMMVQNGDFQYFANSDFQAVDLPYGAGNFRMSILLPNPLFNIDSLIAQFNQQNWDMWMGSFSKSSGILKLPKFTMEYKIKLNDVLSDLGMAVAFTDQADFAEMYPPGNLFISRVKHKTFVKVNEEGTEAAAVTSVAITLTSSGGEFAMRVDRPFIFVIHEKRSKAILFMGKIIEPQLL